MPAGTKVSYVSGTKGKDRKESRSRYLSVETMSTTFNDDDDKKGTLTSVNDDHR